MCALLQSFVAVDAFARDNKLQVWRSWHEVKSKAEDTMHNTFSSARYLHVLNSSIIAICAGNLNHTECLPSVVCNAKHLQCNEKCQLKLLGTFEEMAAALSTVLLSTDFALTAAQSDELQLAMVCIMMKQLAHSIIAAAKSFVLGRGQFWDEGRPQSAARVHTVIE